MSELSNALLVRSVSAAAALPAHRFVTLAGAHPAAGGPSAGVTRHAADAAGDSVSYTAIGTATVEAGGAFTVQSEVKSDAAGRAVDRAGADSKAGVALEAAAAAGDRVEVLVHVEGD